METEIDLKLVFLGSSSVGKTSLITRYAHGVFKAGLQTTVGAGFLAHLYQKENMNITLLLWDTAGDERFRSVAPCLLHGSDGLVLVFSLAEKDSFQEIGIYYDMIMNTVELDISKELPIIILGNKCDLEERAVNEAEIQQWMQEHNISMYAEVSAKTGEGIQSAVEDKLVEMILSGRKNESMICRKSSFSIQIPAEPAKIEKKCC